MQRLLTPLLAFVLLLAPCGHGRTRVFHYDSGLGVASESGGTICLTIANRNLPVGQIVSLVLLTPQQAVVQTEVLRVLPNGCQNPEPAAANQASYELRIVKGTLPSLAPAIAVVNPPRPLRQSGNFVVADLNGDHQLDYFRQCTSSEGVHLTVWAGKPLTGKRLWHEYFYLGYDVEPNCTDQDVADGHP
ncbi:MAG TPA: hypothetical protein VMT39_01120 [Candidatus Bathyarchaeia archaeon]|nr:hypothetical protein [Candidatus Bathyarchaeia archaeon]